MHTAQYWIDHLRLQPHPEGGYYKETYRSGENISIEALPKRFKGLRSCSTAIYFLLRSHECSHFHRIQSDELWHFYAGSTLSIYVITASGHLVVHKLGCNVARGESLQVVVPANCWFGAKVEAADGYALAGCTVAPGFDFEDFEMADRQLLLQEFPLHADAIWLLTNPSTSV